MPSRRTARRLVFKAVLFLLLGAVVNVGVATACADLMTVTAPGKMKQTLFLKGRSGNSYMITRSSSLTVELFAVAAFDR